MELELFGEKQRQRLAATLLVVHPGRVAPALMLGVHEDFGHLGDD
jgi:hypothetical protein